VKTFLLPLLLLFSFGLYAQQKGSVYDSRNGKVYGTIQIGEQLWMTENLNFVTDTGSWCYDDSHENCALFGRTYDFHTAKNVCPETWSLPSKADVQKLFEYVGNQNTVASLKQGGDSGFDALMGGWRGEYNGSYHKGKETKFWTSTTGNAINSWYFGIYENQNIVRIDYDSRGMGFYVRCIKTQKN